MSTTTALFWSVVADVGDAVTAVAVAVVAAAAAALVSLIASMPLLTPAHFDPPGRRDRRSALISALRSPLLLRLRRSP
jgi:hypothetical protein